MSLRIPDIAAHPETYGFPPHHPPMHVPPRRAGPSIGGKTVGNLYLTDKLAAAEFSADDQELVELFALHAGIAIQNARLHQEVQQLAVVDERLRISRDLHDGIIQSIYAVSLSLEDVPDLMSDAPEARSASIGRSIACTRRSRDIRRFIVGLGPEVEGGLLTARVEAMAAEILAARRSPGDLTGAGARRARVRRRRPPMGSSRSRARR